MNNLSDEERHIERLLAELAPRDSRMNRDRTMFLAGHASGQSPPTVPRANGWVWPAVTVCSTAAGLLAGVLIANWSQREAPVVQRDVDDAPNQQPVITSVKSETEAAIAAADSPVLFELRLAMANRAADEFALAGSDWSPRDRPPAANGGPAGGPRAPLTYGAALGRLREDETHL